VEWLNPAHFVGTGEGDSSMTQVFHKNIVHCVVSADRNFTVWALIHLEAPLWRGAVVRSSKHGQIRDR
jgi:hypothetical protein